jgi:hypothetical protein
VAELAITRRVLLGIGATVPAWQLHLLPPRRKPLLPKAAATTSGYDSATYNIATYG